MSDASEPTTTEDLASGLEDVEKIISADSFNVKPILLEAAQRLRQLEAENARLTDAYQRTCVGIGYRSPESQGDPTPPEWAHSLRHRAEQLEAENAELRKQEYRTNGPHVLVHRSMLDQLRTQLAEAQRNREQERARLAACYVAAADPTAEPLASGAYSWSPSYEEVVKLRSQLAEAERDRERFHQQIEAAVSYAGILAIEVKDLIGLAIAHGFKGWPEHQVIGDELRAILQLEQGEIEAAGREAIDEARAREAEQES